MNERTHCDRLAMLVDRAHALVHAGRVGRGLDLLCWASEQRQKRCIGRKRKGGARD